MIDGEEPAAAVALAFEPVLVHLSDEADHVATLEAQFPVTYVCPISKMH